MPVPSDILARWVELIEAARMRMEQRRATDAR